ncbi:hypothetical protein BKA69DRAFT_1125828 [Paraphysoderma sedebokerense]|nr:hypothetical protein BKA69DRAFT_1125828 [Paraphysoderma sedebokerense]
MSASDRYIRNPHPFVPTEDFKHKPLSKERVQQFLLSSCTDIIRHCDLNDYYANWDVYVGYSGIALMFYRLHRYDPQWLINGMPPLHYATKYLSVALDNLQREQQSRRNIGHVGFLCTAAGTYAIASVVLEKVGQHAESRSYLSRLLHLLPHAIHSHEYSEFLYGGSGYLYALNFVKSHIGDDISQPCRDAIDNAVREVIHSILQKGRQGAARLKQERLSLAVSEAHGVAGILHTLLSCKSYLSDDDLDDIKDTVEWLLDFQYESGNFPSSVERYPSSDKLVQYCHGAPGFVSLLHSAIKLFDSEILQIKSKNSLSACLHATFTRGVLRKGPGLCHGLSGSLFTFLANYMEYRDDADMYRSSIIAQYILESEKLTRQGELRIPDRPWSLFEGIAGAVWAMIDYLEILKLHEKNEMSKTDLNILDEGDGGPADKVEKLWKVGGFPCFADV